MKQLKLPKDITDKLGPGKVLFLPKEKIKELELGEHYKVRSNLAIRINAYDPDAKIYGGVIYPIKNGIKDTA